MEEQEGCRSHNGTCDVQPGEKGSLGRKAWPALWINVGHAGGCRLRESIRVLQTEERLHLQKGRPGWNVENSSKGTQL